MSEHGARAHQQAQIQDQVVDVNELRAKRAAALQQDFPLGTRNAPSTGIRVPNPTPTSEEQPKPKEGGDAQEGHTKDNTLSTGSN